LTTYRDAGVDPDKADRLVAFIKERVRETFGDASDLIGGFAGGIPIRGFNRPVIFTATDGVGTKLKIAQEMGIHSTVGIDLVAMNVNDVITTGAKPLLFLDYIATGRIQEEVLKEVIEGIIRGCREADCLLAGGETAEMPGFYPEGVYDLAGFCLGIAEEEEVIDPSEIGEGDVLLGISSNGFHSNGYSLIRKVLSDNGISLSAVPEDLGTTIGEVLLKPTAIYVKDIQTLKGSVKIKGIAHITGGGIPGNLIRILPQKARAVIDLDQIMVPPEMMWLSSAGKIPRDEMIRTFNIGVGMIVVLDEKEGRKALTLLGDRAKIIGHIERGKREVLFRGTFQS